MDMVQLWWLKPTIYGIRHVLLQSEILHYFYFGIQIVFSFLDGDWTVLFRIGWPAGALVCYLWLACAGRLGEEITLAVVGECLSSKIWLGNEPN